MHKQTYRFLSVSYMATFALMSCLHFFRSKTRFSGLSTYYLQPCAFPWCINSRTGLVRLYTSRACSGNIILGINWHNWIIAVLINEFSIIIFGGRNNLNKIKNTSDIMENIFLWRKFIFSSKCFEMLLNFILLQFHSGGAYH